LRAAEADKNRFDAAANNIVKLQAYLDGCNNNLCKFLPQARARLAELRAAEADKSKFDAATNDIGKLQAYVDGCNDNTCKFLPQAQARLAELRANEFRTYVNYDLYGGDIDKDRYIKGIDQPACAAACRSNGPSR
jgi:biotin synthase-related radical SAM superfamily protein